ncbi:unnamed protein product [Ambrosiozyma monospora]|uniref:Unnamed protein product n=1 Tax=Ambrosiozyma monospora TaxID=43982 RepID=A0ACB5U9K2_AMBMO|nr:unnamed protein product [Ambrosiozyma monospora]
MNLPEEFFLPYHSQSDNQLRLLHYPPTSQQDLKEGKTERIGAHSDFGTITMLLQDSCGGLQVECPRGSGIFVDAPCIPGSLVINTGDLLMRWSNDQLKSTLHRVCAPPVDHDASKGSQDNCISKVRYSVPFFIQANPSSLIEAIPGTFDRNHPKKYEPIYAGDYIDMRMNSTY